METKDLPPFRVPSCQKPLILVNKRALYLLQENGIPSAGWLAPMQNVNEIDVKALLRKAYGIVHSRKKLNYMLLKQFYVELNGRVEYMFNVVGCQKCPSCIKIKRDDFSVRCQMESELYDCPAYFFTLTYDRKHLPKDKQVHVSDIQDFFKRLRIRWTRKGLDHAIRYVVAGEYGHKRKRAHYHVILWNNPYHASELEPAKELQLKLDVFEAWSKCKWQAFDFQQCYGGAARYASKYVYKRSYKNTKRFWLRPFLLTSRGNGGIGSAMIRKYVDLFRQYPSLDKIGWTSRFDGVFYEFGIGSYAKSILRPSLSSYVPSGLSFYYRDLVQRLERHVMNGAMTSLEAFSIAERCRPYKSIMINPMLSDRTLQPVKGCWLKAVWLFNKERQHLLINSIMLEDQLDVPSGVIDDYYRCKSYGYDQDRDPMLDVVQKDFIEKAIQDVVLDKSLS